MRFVPLDTRAASTPAFEDHCPNGPLAGAELLFDVISTAYERTSMIVTSNVPFESWTEVDAERASHITWAFEAYASGDYTLRQLAEELEERGLRTKGTAKRPSRALGSNHLQRLLRKPFYIGHFTWGGVSYQGTHDPLTTVETFAAVQAQLTAKNTAEERTQHHEHYLKGTL